MTQTKEQIEEFLTDLVENHEEAELLKVIEELVGSLCEKDSLMKVSEIVIESAMYLARHNPEIPLKYR